MDFILVAVGFTASILMGLTGIGGAVYTTPTLIFLGIDPLKAVGSTVAFLTVAKCWGTLLHIRKKNVDFTTLKYLLLGGVLAAIIIYPTLSYTINFSSKALSWFLTILLGLLLLGIGLHHLLTFSRKTKHARKHGGQSQLIKLSGLLVGALVSSVIQFTSIGGGSLLMPYLIRTMKNPRIMVGTSLSFSFITALLASILHASLGNVSPTISLPLILGSLPGTYLGTTLTTHIQKDKLLTAMAVSLILVGLILIGKTI